MKNTIVDGASSNVKKMNDLKAGSNGKEEIKSSAKTSVSTPSPFSESRPEAIKNKARMTSLFSCPPEGPQEVDCKPKTPHFAKACVPVEAPTALEAFLDILSADEVLRNHRILEKHRGRDLAKAVFKVAQKHCKDKEAIKEVLVRKDSNRIGTRANIIDKTSDLVTKSPADGSVNFGYGQFTFDSLIKIVKAMVQPQKLLTMKPVPAWFRLKTYNHFLDIGSGFGYPNLVATAYRGCYGLGIEVADPRHIAANEVLQLLKNDEKLGVIDWSMAITFKHEDACKNDGPFAADDGTHCRHIFAYNYL